MRIPYGMSNFAELRREGYFYVDKTPFLPVLEQLTGRYMLFLRPRRMGKSLLVSMMAHYYDLRLRDQFDELFGGLWIHENPTRERARYVVMQLDFSQVTTDSGIDGVRRAFLAAVENSARSILARYGEEAPEIARLPGSLGRHQEPDAMLQDLLGAVHRAGYQVFVLIDEYDNFTNRLLSEGAHDVYEALATKTGFVRSFYATLKAGTASGAISRIFITGVTPLLLDDMSSGFNIATNLSTLEQVNALAGLTHREVELALDTFLASRPHLRDLPEMGDRGRLLSVLEDHYDGYRFSATARERVFNSDMVLYFLKDLADQGTFPTDMLDLNVRTDYGRIQRLASMAGSDAKERREVLEAIVGNGGIESPLVRQFGAVASISSRESFVSLLYYMGLLTLAEQSLYLEEMRFSIPNRVIRELQWEHLAAMLTEQEHLSVDVHELRVALSKMASLGDIHPFLDLFHDRVIRVMGNKDLRRFDERTIKLALLAFLSLSRLFHPLSEKEFAQGYCDLFLGPSPRYPNAKYAWLLELKYVPQAATPARIEEAFAEASAQVTRYAGDAELIPLLTRGQTLKAGALVFVGAKKVLFRPWPPEPGAPAARTKSAGAKSTASETRAARKTSEKAPSKASIARKTSEKAPSKARVARKTSAKAPSKARVARGARKGAARGPRL